MQSLRKSWRMAPAIAAMGAMFLFAGVPQLRADDDHHECRERIERAQSKLDRAVSRHGEGSRQAEHARRDLNAQRDRCWSRYHGYWGHDARWHDQRDWDDRDHDRH
jgi:hypothetical protein